MSLQGNFCHHCGQKSYTPRLTMQYLFKDLVSLITDIEKGFWYTLIQLFTHPSRVIQEYIDGKRKRYYNPFRYLFLVSAIMLATYSYSGFSKKVSENYQKQLQQSFQEDSLVVSKTDSLSIRGGGRDKLAEEHEIQVQVNKKWIENYLFFLQTTNPVLYILFLLPSISVAYWLLLRKRKGAESFNFAECVVVNAYLAAQISIISTLSMLILYALAVELETISTLSFLLMIPFYFWAIYPLFKKRPLVFFFKTSAVLLLSMVFYVVVVIFVTTVYTVGEMIGLS